MLFGIPTYRRTIAHYEVSCRYKQYKTPIVLLVVMRKRVLRKPGWHLQGEIKFRSGCTEVSVNRTLSSTTKPA